MDNKYGGLDMNTKKEEALIMDMVQTFSQMYPVRSLSLSLSSGVLKWGAKGQR